MEEVSSDGSVVSSDGSVIPSDGSVIASDGSAIPSDGSVISEEESDVMMGSSLGWAGGLPQTQVVSDASMMSEVQDMMTGCSRCVLMQSQRWSFVMLVSMEEMARIDVFQIWLDVRMMVR